LQILKNSLIINVNRRNLVIPRSNITGFTYYISCNKEDKVEYKLSVHLLQPVGKLKLINQKGLILEEIIKLTAFLDQDKCCENK